MEPRGFEEGPGSGDGLGFRGPDLRGLNFKVVHIVIAGSRLSRLDIANLNQVMIQECTSQIQLYSLDDPLDFIVDRIGLVQSQAAGQAGDTGGTPLHLLEADIDAHERLLVALLGMNHWEAQLSLQTPFSLLHTAIKGAK